MKRWALLVVQVVVTIALLGFLFSRDSFRQDLVAVLRTAKPMGLFVAVLGAGVVNALCWIRWWVCLRILGMDVSLGRALRFYSVGLFASLFLLGPVGGDAIRVGLLWRDGHPKALAALSVLVDRLGGLVALIFCTAALTAFRWEWFAQDWLALRLVQGLWVYLAGATLVLVISLVVSRLGWVNRLPARAPARSHLVGLADAWARLSRHAGLSLGAVGLSLASVVVSYWVFALCASAFRVEVAWRDVFAVMPVVDAVATLPVSVAGLGLREAMFEVMLERLAGVPPAASVLMSLGGFVCMTVWCVAGGLGLLGYRSARTGDRVKLTELGTES
jgi:glycosyltransferase 2 family protein